jgi:hypothetical protein
MNTNTTEHRCKQCFQIISDPRRPLTNVADWRQEFTDYFFTEGDYDKALQNAIDISVFAFNLEYLISYFAPAFAQDHGMEWDHDPETSRKYLACEIAPGAYFYMDDDQVIFRYERSWDDFFGNLLKRNYESM